MASRKEQLLLILSEIVDNNGAPTEGNEKLYDYVISQNAYLAMLEREYVVIDFERIAAIDELITEWYFDNKA